MDTFQGERQNLAPNDPYFRNQWALGNNAGDINWQEGKAKYRQDSHGGSPNGPKLVVAVIDSGIDPDHPDLRNELWKNPGEIAGNGIDDDNNGIVDDIHGVNFMRRAGNPTNNPWDDYGHGTHCAGIIAASANNGQGVAGVAGFSKGKVQIMALRTFDVNGGQATWTIEALNYAISKGARLSSNSYGGTTGGSQINPMFQRILRQNPNHLFVSAAGNDNQKVTTSGWPNAARASNHICVASSTSSASRSSFSNYGTPYVNVFAPGSRILSTMPRNKGSYGYYDGTSMACPMVSGLAALIMTMRGNLNGAQVKQLIEQNVQKKSQFNGLVTTGGLIDVDKTIKAVIGGGSTTTPAPPPCADKQGREAWCQRYRYFQVF